MQVQMQLEDPGQCQMLGVPIPTKHQNAFYQATELDRRGDHKAAEKIYLQLLSQDFENPILHAALGMCYASQELNGLAWTLLDRALNNISGMLSGFKRLGITPKSGSVDDLTHFMQTKRSEILNALGTCYKHENNVPKAREYFLAAQEGLPLNADIQNNLGTLYINEGRPDKALEHLQLATTLNPKHPQALWNTSLAHLEMGFYEEGWKNYDAGFDAMVRMERNYTPPNNPLPRWDGSPGKNLIVYGEQGIGDEILFASCLPDLMKVSKSVVLDCHKRLHRLFCDTFPGIDIYPTREESVLHWPNDASGKPRYNFDARVALGSLPAYFRKSVGDFPGTPFLKTNVAREAEWTLRLAKLGDKPKIGISWVGGHKRTRVEVRSMQLEQLLPVLKQDAVFVSLQYTDCLAEIEALRRNHGVNLHFFPEATHADQYAECAALVANLDLVITVCTSVVWLAGGLGVPCWVLTPSRPAWRYRIEGDDVPWFKSITLFRQAPDSTDWTPVVDEVAGNLANLLSGIQK